MIRLVLVLSSLLCSLSAQGQFQKVIYGQDDRLNYGDATSKQQKLADSTAGMVNQRKLQFLANGDVSFQKELFGDTYMGNQFENGPVCREEPFREQYTLPSCTGFLVAPDILATAAHCVSRDRSCEEELWLFGLDEKTMAQDRLGADHVYRCSEIIERGDRIKDYALIKLDREVVGRDALKLSQREVTRETPLMVIGHPSGLPLKVSPHGRIFSLSRFTFRAGLDSYAGNSGSPVFDRITNEVVGILSRGADDYVYDRSVGCMRSNICQSDFTQGPECFGETVTSIEVLSSFF